MQQRGGPDQTAAASRHPRDKLASAQAGHPAGSWTLALRIDRENSPSPCCPAHPGVPGWGPPLPPVSRPGAKAPGQQEWSPRPGPQKPWASAGQWLGALHLQALAQEKGVLLGVTTQEVLQHDAGILRAPGSQDAASVVHADLRGAEDGAGPGSSLQSGQLLGVPGHPSPAPRWLGGQVSQGKCVCMPACADEHGQVTVLQDRGG